MISCPASMRVSPDVVYRRLGDTAVLVHLGTNEIFELNDSGARLWELLGDGHGLDEAILALVREFEVDEATARRECDDLVTELVGRKLLETA
jgi:hypothetical protein